MGDEQQILLLRVIKKIFHFALMLHSKKFLKSLITCAKTFCYLKWCFYTTWNCYCTFPAVTPRWHHLTWAWVLSSLQGCGWCSWAVEVHVEPLGVAAMPHTSLLWLAGARPSLTVDVLRQADVGDAGGILANQMDVGVENGGVHWFAVFTQNYG